MALRTCLHRLATLLSDVCFVRRRSVVVLWRLRQTSDVAEAVCSFTEPTPLYRRLWARGDGTTGPASPYTFPQYGVKLMPVCRWTNVMHCGWHTDSVFSTDVVSGTTRTEAPLGPTGLETC